MVARHLASPEFGQADLSNCEREQIHRAGSIQPHGALLVVSEPDQGFVLLFTDVTEQKAAEAARRRFQESIIEGRQILSRRLSSRASPLYRNLLSSIVENAELAALEITAGVDTAHIPEMLEGLGSQSPARRRRPLD